MAVRAIPEGYHTVTPYLIVTDAERVLEFARKGLGAEERAKMANDDGTLMHAEFQVGDSVVMLAEANQMWPAMPSTLHLYVDDCDALYKRAVDAGAEPVQEPTNQFYGDRSGGVRDSAGNLWWISTHVEDVSPDEMAKRAAQAKASAGG